MEKTALATMKTQPPRHACGRKMRFPGLQQPGFRRIFRLAISKSLSNVLDWTVPVWFAQRLHDDEVRK